MGALEVPRVSVEEYLAADEDAELKSEYYDGQVFPLETATLGHAAIAVNIIAAASNRLDSTPCRAYSFVRVKVTATRYVYPDLAVVCGAAIATDSKGTTLTNPQVVFEILSPATRDYDRGGKFDLYQSILSIQEYVLISQDAPRVDVYRRTQPNQWQLTIYTGLDAIVKLESLAIEVPAAEIFSRISFES